MGQWLRNRYNSILDKYYSPNNIFVRADNIERCVQSALENLAGIYSQTNNPTWNPSIQFQPQNAVYAMPEGTDNLLTASMNCTAFDTALKVLDKTSQFKQLEKNLKPMYNYLTSYTGTKVNSMKKARHTYSTLNIEHLYNFE